VFEKGEGSYVYVAPDNASFDHEYTTQELKKYLDLTCGIGVTNLGHSHPAITKAAQAQVGRIVHSQVNIAFNKKQLELIRKLTPLMPHKSLDSFFFWNSGAEAVEAAVKLARQATGRQNIIVVQGSYHGRTFVSRKRAIDPKVDSLL
jgi:4-aminobutyrate aminotransferase